MAAVPPLSGLKTITHVTSHPTQQTVTPGDGNLGDAGAIASATGLGPQPWESAIDPGDMLKNVAKEIAAFHDAVNKFVANNPVDASIAAYLATKAWAAWSKYGSQVMESVQKYGSSALQALTGLASGTMRVVGGVLEGVGGDIVPPVIIDPQTLGGMNNIVAFLGGPGSPAAEAFAAGASAVAGGFSGTG